MTAIKSVSAREILDSRGNPTVEVTLTLKSGSVGLASVPSGASTGAHEALELRDGDKKRYNGKGVLKAVTNVNKAIAKAVVGKTFKQDEIDGAMIKLDGTPTKSKLGANAILGVSLAFARAMAAEKKLELYEYIGSLVKAKKYALPQPMFNIINGGKHADSGLEIQEFMIGPVGFKKMADKVRVAAEVTTALRTILHDKGLSTGIGDEGGFAPHLSSDEEALKLLVEAITKAGYTTDQVKIGLDAASSSFYEGDRYKLKIDGKEVRLTSDELIAWYEKMVATYPIISIEDGLAEEDWDGFARMTAKVGNKISTVGDDLLVTNVARIATAIEKKSVNSVLIKPNQIGSLTETIQAVEMTKKQGWKPFVSHRSGETADTFISDLAVGLSCTFIKAGAPVRGERVVKYNRLMEIAETL